MRARFRLPSMRLDTRLFATLLLILNAPLLVGHVTTSLVFRPDLVLGGEWWRVVTHPFVHVSWYHLLLDAGAFLMLYEGLREARWARRLWLVAAGGLGSLAFAWMFSSAIDSSGLCGLSGVAHGLMAVSGLEMVMQGERGSWDRRIGWLAFLAVAGKSIWEAGTGLSFLGFLHFGLMGDPQVVCHAGGVFGGAVAFLILRLTKEGIAS